MASIDYSYTPEGQQLTTDAGGFGGGGGFGGINYRALEEMMREKAERERQREAQGRREAEAWRRRAYSDNSAAQKKADFGKDAFQRIALRGAQRADRVAGAQARAQMNPAKLRPLGAGLGGGMTMDTQNMSALEKQAHLPGGSGFSGYTPTGQELEDADEDAFRRSQEADEEFADAEDERARQAQQGSPAERFARQNPYLSGMLTGRGAGRGGGVT